MNALKKLAVLLLGLLFILGVTLVLFNTAPKIGSADPMSGVDNSERDPVGPEEFDYDENPALERDTMQVSASHPRNIPVPLEEDSLNWNTPSSLPAETSVPNLGDMSLFPDERPSGIFMTAARKIVPAVVTIHSSKPADGALRDSHPFLWPDDENGEGGRIPGSGSGIIISSNGYIMTNYHVVESADQLRVTLSDETSYVARFLGADPATDVALLKVDAEDLPAAFIGNSDGVEIGQWVMAVGNPLNFASTVTTGIISALGRDINIIDSDYRIENFLQTDAVINPGNSGGALVNLNGEVIGMNTAIATRSGFYQGYGFAIPVNLAKKVVNDIKVYGRVRRPLLGVSIDPVNYRVATALGLPHPTGALIQGIHDGFPAKEAGLLQGDIILAVNGVDVHSVNDLQNKIAQYQPNDMVELRIWRDAAETAIKLKLAEAPQSEKPITAAEAPEKPLFKNLGLSVRTLRESDKNKLGVEQGVYITGVSGGSPAADGRVFANTVLLTIDKVPISSIDAFETIVESAESGDVLMLHVKETTNRVGGDTRLLFVEVP